MVLPMPPWMRLLLDGRGKEVTVVSGEKLIARD